MCPILRSNRFIGLMPINRMFCLSGDCDMAVCGGVNCIIEPRVFVALSKAKMISPNGTSKPFCQGADGYGRGEGCGVVLLKPLKKVGSICTRHEDETVPFFKHISVKNEITSIYNQPTNLSEARFFCGKKQ